MARPGRRRHPRAAAATLALLFVACGVARAQPQLTGRRGRRLYEACQAGWNRQAHVAEPFEFSRNGTSPLAYGGIAVGSVKAFETTGPEVADALILARERGLLGDGEVDVVGARRVESDIVVVTDSGQCEQILWEVSLPSQQHAGGAVTAWLRPRVGSVDYLTVRSPAPLSAEHHIAVSKDSHGHSAIMQHTSFPIDDGQGAEARPLPSASASASASFSTISFNIWHTMVPAMADPSPDKRWEMYMKRLRHLVAAIVESDADVVGLQEVRYDEGFGPPGQHSQLEHLLALLPPGAYPHYVFQPAMSFANGAVLKGPRGFAREEEGLAILSRHPIRRSSYLLLPRNVRDGADGHQRICLHAEVHKPGIGPVDVFTTHLSLSHRAREAAVVEIQTWAAQQQQQCTSPSRLQLLLGDFNAEPHEKAFRFLVGDPEGELRGGLGDWTDAWTAAHGDDAGLTFPSWKPVKRIDFILYRDAAGGEPAQCPDSESESEATCSAAARSPLQLAHVELLGAEPTEDTRHLGGGSMLDPGSPVWPSDHLGIIARFDCCGAQKCNGDGN